MCGERKMTRRARHLNHRAQKYCQRLESDRSSRPMKRSTIFRAFVAVVTSAAFLWTLTLSVSPQLHERIHPDANRVDHSCAVTFVASGNYNHSPLAPLVSA